jgi:hypothetical protein
MLTKRILLGAFTLLLGVLAFTSGTSRAYGATLYSQTGTSANIDTMNAFTTNDGQYVYGAGMTSTPSGYPAESFWTTSGSPNKIQIARVDGNSCGDIPKHQNNGGLSFFSTTFVEYKVVSTSGVDIGSGVCEYEISSLGNGVELFSINITGQNAGSDLENLGLVLAGSLSNSGYSRNGANDNFFTGGVAFQICNTTCDSNLTISSPPPVEPCDTTKICTHSPVQDEVVATSTPVDISVQFFTEGNDYRTDMMLEVRIQNLQNEFTRAQCASLGCLLEGEPTFKDKVLASGLYTSQSTNYSFATSTLGRYSFTSILYRPRISVFGYTYGKVEIARKLTTFIVGAKNEYDTYQDTNGNIIDLITGNIDPNNPYATPECFADADNPLKANFYKKLIIPCQADFAKWGTLAEDMETRLPFSYAYDMVSVGSELFNASSSTSTLGISANIKNPAGSGTTSLVFISASMIEAVPYTGFIKTILGYLIWIMFALFVYRQILKIHNNNHTPT